MILLIVILVLIRKDHAAILDSNQANGIQKFPSSAEIHFPFLFYKFSKLPPTPQPVMSSAHPRINTTLLSNYVGRSVTIVGKMAGGSGHLVHLEGPDGGNVVIDRSTGNNRHWGTQFVEVRGIVSPDRSIRESDSTDFGNDFGQLPAASFVSSCCYQSDNLFLCRFEDVQ